MPDLTVLNARALKQQVPNSELALVLCDCTIENRPTGWTFINQLIHHLFTWSILKTVDTPSILRTSVVTSVTQKTKKKGGGGSLLLLTPDLAFVASLPPPPPHPTPRLPPPPPNTHTHTHTPLLRPPSLSNTVVIARSHLSPSDPLHRWTLPLWVPEEPWARTLCTRLPLTRCRVSHLLFLVAVTSNYTGAHNKLNTWKISATRRAVKWKIGPVGGGRYSARCHGARDRRGRGPQWPLTWLPQSLAKRYFGKGSTSNPKVEIRELHSFLDLALWVSAEHTLGLATYSYTTWKRTYTYATARSEVTFNTSIAVYLLLASTKRGSHWFAIQALSKCCCVTFYTHRHTHTRARAISPPPPPHLSLSLSLPPSLPIALSLTLLSGLSLVCSLCYSSVILLGVIACLYIALSIYWFVSLCFGYRSTPV